MIEEKIKQLRKENKMTQIELSKKLGTSQPVLNRWETGARSPSLRTLKKIAKVFNLSLDVLALDEKDLKHLNIKDKSALSRLSSFGGLEEREQETILNLIDNFKRKHTATV